MTCHLNLSMLMKHAEHTAAQVEIFATRSADKPPRHSMQRPFAVCDNWPMPWTIYNPRVHSELHAPASTPCQWLNADAMSGASERHSLLSHLDEQGAHSTPNT